MVYYCEKNQAGEIVAMGAVSDTDVIPVGGEVCTKAQRDAWVAECKARMAKNEEEAAPTPMEQLRADMDYLAALQGVTL